MEWNNKKAFAFKVEKKSIKFLIMSLEHGCGQYGTTWLKEDENPGAKDIGIQDLCSDNSAAMVKSNLWV